jgi:hypothetical protein
LIVYAEIQLADGPPKKLVTATSETVIKAMEIGFDILQRITYHIQARRGKESRIIV